MEILYIQPISKQPFWNAETSKSTEDVGVDNYNDLFWSHFSNITMFKKLFREEIWKNDLDTHATFTLVKKNLETSYNTFCRSRDEDVDTVDLLDATYILYNAFELVRKAHPGIQLGFSRESIRLNPERAKDFLMRFYLDHPISSPSKQWFIPVFTKNVALQIQAIYTATEMWHGEEYMPKEIVISLASLVEYEEKGMTEQDLRRELSSIPIPLRFIHTDKELLEEFSKVPYQEKKRIIGKKMRAFPFFSRNCPWRRCTFCNIGKWYAYSSLSLEKKIESIHEKIDFIQENGIDCISVIDPSVTTMELDLIAKTFKSRNFSIPMHIRTRYDKRFADPKFAKELFDAGVRYMGIGLEVGSERVNRLIDKHNVYPTLDDIEYVTEVLMDAGVKVHHYAISGFPTETAEELNMTRDFLVKMSDRFHDRFYTYTISGFFLSKESYIYKNPEKFGLILPENNVTKGHTMSMTESYTEIGATEELRKYRSKTMKELQFHTIFGFSEKGSSCPDKFIDDIWGVLERTSLLHVQKCFHDKNPYVIERLKAWLISRGLYIESER